MLKEFKEKFSPLMLTVIIIVGIFITLYADYAKKTFISSYRKNIAVLQDDLDEHKKKAALERLDEMEHGRLLTDEEHDTQDFMHTSYFGEPWRKWESTPIVWHMSRNAYWVFVVMVLLYVPFSRLHHFLYVYIARKKIAKASATGKTPQKKTAAPEASAEETELAPVTALRPFNIAFNVNWKFTGALIIILFAVMVNLSISLSKQRSQFFPTNLDRPIGVQLFSEMIGESRTILASYIYIRADMYHHERQEKIRWDKDPVTLPLYRIITALDPKFENAYDFGAWHLAKNFNKYNEALAFLQEGLLYSPESFQLRFTMGDIYYFKGDYEASAKYYQKALDKAQDAVAVKNCLRRLYWCRRMLKQYNEALGYLGMLYNMDPTDPVLPVLAKEIQDLAAGRITEEDFEKAKQKRRDDFRKEQLMKQLEGDHDHDHHDHNHDGHRH